MAVIKVKKISCDDSSIYVRNVNNYIFQKKDQYGNIILPLNRGGYGVDFSNPEISTNQMLRVKEIFGRENNVALAHIMVCYGKSVTNAQQACALTLSVASLFMNSYQLVYCTHGKDEDHVNYHTHLGINPINLNTRLMMRTDHMAMKSLEDFVTALTGERCYTVFLKENQKRYV